MKTSAFGLLGFILMLSLEAPPSNADTVVVGAPNALGSFRYGIDDGAVFAAEFSLSDSRQVSTIDVTVRTSSETGLNTFDLSLQDSLANPGTVFASSTLTAPLGAVSTVSMNVDQTLQAGTYYLTITPGYFDTPVPFSAAIGWVVSDGSYTEQAGAVAGGLWAGDGLNFLFLTGDAFNDGFLFTAPVFAVNADPTDGSDCDGTGDGCYRRSRALKIILLKEGAPDQQ